MTNMDKLRGKLAEKRMSVEELAGLIGLTKSTVYRRISTNGEAFTVGEANKIVEVLNLTTAEALAIFFAADVA